ncbi:MAG: protein kinase [Myxococcales bacterium]|nr:protein kinase [Myxococcales bacterium]
MDKTAPPDLSAWIERALHFEKWSIAKLISLFEDARPEASKQRHEVITQLRQHPKARSATFVGLTGTPGAGKSSLVGALVPKLLSHPRQLSLAILAIDPSSPLTGGAVLGDRTRVKLPPKEKRVFFRSQSSDQDLGGLSRNTFQVCRLLYWLFDIVLIETVGIGQSEISIRHAADHVYLLLQPLAGDELQFIKAGIMEIPDAFVLHKADAPEASKTYHTLKATLGLLQHAQGTARKIHRTSIVTQQGIDDLAAEIASLQTPPLHAAMLQREAYAFQRWILDRYGRLGLEALTQQQDDSTRFLRGYDSLDQAQEAFASYFWDWASACLLSRSDKEIVQITT